MLRESEKKEKDFYIKIMLREAKVTLDLEYYIWFPCFRKHQESLLHVIFLRVFPIFKEASTNALSHFKLEWDSSSFHGQNLLLHLTVYVMPHILFLFNTCQY
jgi:hypothetical protein